MKQVERECPNEEMAKKYATIFEAYYNNVEVFERNGFWFVRYDKEEINYGNGRWRNS
jgi:hypothetical protein